MALTTTAGQGQVKDYHLRDVDERESVDLAMEKVLVSECQTGGVLFARKWVIVARPPSLYAGVEG